MNDPKPSLQKQGVRLPLSNKVLGTYRPAVICSATLMVSGNLPLENGQLIAKGQVGCDVTVETAALGARQCVLNALGAVDSEIQGNWARLARLTRSVIFVATSDEGQHIPYVADAASTLLQEIFGADGLSARTAIGVAALPMNASVEVELTFDLASNTSGGSA